MSVLVNRETRLLVQGITGREGSTHTIACREYGTKVVAGVTPGRGGEQLGGIPVFDSVAEAVEKTGANASLIFVPAPFAADAIFEAAAADLPLVVCITEGIPNLDMVKVRRYLIGSSVRLIGPNCPGVITPGQAKIGIMPGEVFAPGSIGILSRSGTLLYEAASQLSSVGLGQSTAIGLGGDPIVGTTFVEALALLEADPDTEAITIIGEIGGRAEQEAAAFIEASVTKPVFALVVGQAAPPERRMGHAGAIITNQAETASAKINALENAGVRLIKSPASIGETVRQGLSS
jgi:succinyl-CoA synthetase alpha subunit